jgi:hypothetical protein
MMAKDGIKPPTPVFSVPSNFSDSVQLISAAELPC